jgi:ABC-type Na+ efflux pump permease subunit
MRDLSTVTRLELTLLLRSRGWWITALIMVALGVWAAAGAREAPWSGWSNLAIIAVLGTLILTFSTGDQVSRDRERHLDGVLLSTPVSTAAYVWGKYLAALAMLLGVAAAGLAGAALTDQFYTWRNPPAVLGHSTYPPLGPRPYLLGWLWLDLTPLIFGAALTLAGITIARGQRIVAYAATLVLWLMPMLFGGWPDLLDVTASRLNYSRGSADTLTAAKMALAWASAHGFIPGRGVTEHVMRLVQQNVPPHLPTIFVWNRALFVCLAVVLITGTVHSVGRRRQRGA